jgi:ABC-type glycerol-3-phosphate transport system permease component
MTVVIIVPPLLFALAARRGIVKGMTMGAVK